VGGLIVGRISINLHATVSLSLSTNARVNLHSVVLVLALHLQVVDRSQIALAPHVPSLRGPNKVKEEFLLALPIGIAAAVIVNVHVHVNDVVAVSILVRVVVLKDPARIDGRSNGSGI